ncbi:putative haemolysin domain protein [Taylorella asinigenitalis 14/45]|uniref:Putative haemolysin domain protein n=1 Tax=Taylorella asinigenitalis 14/45 TaxID=1091495 RepID=I7IL96_9BURK|nr:hemolysin family protein [Taylorella asinigenitalis]CCG19904.1 putative haemolysin domain protein [Taylorella asinigenitalis 14/45]
MIDILIILFLTFINGIFAMSEIAVVSSKKTRLQKQAEDGKLSAKAALALQHDPARFLSTVQIGITLIGIFSGAFGQASLVSKLTPILTPIFGNFASEISLAIVVISITFLSIVFGELVPKRLAIHYPERIANLISRPMTILSKAVAPFVWILSFSTNLVLKLIGISKKEENSLTEEDISGILHEGASAGLFEKTEHNIVERALSLDDRHIASIMTPRSEIHYIDINAPLSDTLNTIADSPYSRFPVVDGQLDNVLGIVDAGSLFEQQIRGQETDIRKTMKPVKFVPENISAMDLLESLQEHKSEIAVVINEYGEVEGVVTLRDILTVLVGHTIPVNENEMLDAVQRKDGSWLIDGTMTLERFEEIFDQDLEEAGDEDSHYHTVAGFIMHKLGHIPRETESVEWNNYYFEVVDMDKHRIDRVLVKILN